MKLSDADGVLERLFSKTTKNFKERFPQFPVGISPDYSEEDIRGADLASVALSENSEIPPTTSASVMFQCLARIHQARKLVEFVREPGSKIPLNHKVHQIEVEQGLVKWLLIDYWRMAGQHRALLAQFQPRA
jgi:hypothetical protein